MPVSGSPYKDQLHLQLGVGLSAEQMAALTHDIVWLEEVEVNGEKVLAPVVYLAQAEGRLAPNGALIQGRTWERSFADSAARVEAANSLNVQAGRDIANLGGVLQSRGDLSLDAGRDVTVAAVEDRQGQTRWSTSRLQSVTQLGAEVSAGRDLNVSAGRDLTAVAS
ncbi:TPA: hemagglutinin repeat-containing protein, partial [Pseudomonas aeruginosa]